MYIPFLKESRMRVIRLFSLTRFRKSGKIYVAFEVANGLFFLDWVFGETRSFYLTVFRFCVIIYLAFLLQRIGVS